MQDHTSKESHRSTNSSSGGATAAAAAAAASSSSSSSSAAAAASSARSMNLFFPDRPSHTLVLGEKAAPFSQAAACMLADAGNRSSAQARLQTTRHLIDSMEAENARIQAAIEREEEHAAKRLTQKETLQRSICAMQTKLIGLRIGDAERKALLEARAARLARLKMKSVPGKPPVPLTQAEEAQKRFERTEAGSRIKVEAAESILLNDLALLQLQTACEFEAAALLTSDPAHPDHARIREQLAADTAQIKARNADRKEMNNKFLEDKRAEEAADLAKIARVSVVEEEIKKEKQSLEELRRSIHESDAAVAMETALSAEWGRLLDAANSAAPRPEPSAQMAETPAWQEWIRMIDESGQLVFRDIKELAEHVAVADAKINELRCKRASVDKEYAQAYAQLQQMEAEQQRRAAADAQRAGAADTAAARSSLQPQRQIGGGSEDEKMSDESGVPATRSMGPSQQPPQHQQQQRPVQQQPMQRKPVGFVPAAPPPVPNTFGNAGMQPQPVSALAAQRQASKPPLHPMQPGQQLQPQQFYPPPTGPAVYQTRASSPHGPFQAQGSRWVANSANRPMHPQQMQAQQMQAQMAQQAQQQQLQQQQQHHPSGSLQVPPMHRREYFNSNAQLMAPQPQFVQQTVHLTAAQMQGFQQQEHLAQTHAQYAHYHGQ